MSTCRCMWGKQKRSVKIFLQTWLESSSSSPVLSQFATHFRETHLLIHNGCEIGQISFNCYMSFWGLHPQLLLVAFLLLLQSLSQPLQWAREESDTGGKLDLSKPLCPATTFFIQPRWFTMVWSSPQLTGMADKLPVSPPSTSCLRISTLWKPLVTLVPIMCYQNNYIPNCNNRLWYSCVRHLTKWQKKKN